MKKITRTSVFIMAFVSTLLLSCGGDDSSSTNNTPTGAYVHGKVDGTQFETFSFQGLTSVYASKTGTGEDTGIIVSGSDQNMNIIGFTTHGITTTGTYELNDQQAVMLYTDGATETSFDTGECEAAGGTLVITYLDETKIEGTFHFTGMNEDNCSESKNITEGSFRGIFGED